MVFSNTLDCIRRHPAVSGRLNDLAIADFLLFDMIRDPAATSFGHPKAAARARPRVWASGISIRRYWVLPGSAPIHHKRPMECVEQFRELLDRAVADSLRTNSVGILMSGGLDSPTVAASAQRTLARDGSAAGLRAYTGVFESLIPDEERRYAGLVAETLKIPIEFQTDEVECGCIGIREKIVGPSPCISLVGWRAGADASDCGPAPRSLDWLWGRPRPFMPAVGSFLRFAQKGAVGPRAGWREPISDG